MDQQSTPLEGTKIKIISHIMFCIIWLIHFTSFSQQLDTLSNKKKSLDFILGVKLFNTKASPEIRTAINIGTDIYLFKNKKASLSYRNFFSAFITPRDSTFNKNVRFLNSSNSLTFCYQFPIRKSFLKFGIGPYHSREQTFIDQYFVLRDPHGYGIEYLIYTRLKWLNIGYRHQIQLANSKNTYFGINEIYRFSLCIEVPLNIK